MADVFRRCGCRDEEGKQLGTRCPKLAKDPRHGTWGYYIAAGIDPKTGKRRQIRSTKGKDDRPLATKQEAQIERNRVRSALDHGTYVPPAQTLYADFLAEWIGHRAAGGMKPSTLANYKRYITNDIAPSALGRMKLSSIRRYEINAFLDQLTHEGRGATTVRRIAAVIQGSLRAAAMEDRIDVNPALSLRLPKVERAEFEPWTAQQIGQFLDVAVTHRLGALFELAVTTGLRRGELLGLRWADVDLERRILTVRNNRVQAGNTVVEHQPKTRAGRRILDLSDAASGALIAWQMALEAEAANWGSAWTRSGYVFVYEDGTPLKPQYATRLFDKLRVQAGLPKMTLHGQRHEFASLLIEGGADIALVSKILGHTSVSITADVYAHLIGSRARQASDAAAALIPARAHTLHTQRPIGEPEEVQMSSSSQ